MTDYTIVKEELRKGITLSEYVELKGLTEDNWLLIKEVNTGRLIAGVRADSLIGSEKDYYVITVENYIFPQYTVHSERPYYIVVKVSKTPDDLTPFVFTETELIESESEQTAAEDAEEQENPELPEEEDCWSFEHINGLVELTLGTGKKAIKKYYSSIDEMIEDNPDYREVFSKAFSIDYNLTPLERAVFEAFKDSSDLEHEYIFKSLEFGALNNEEEEKYYLNLASDESSKGYVFKYLISKAGLEEAFYSFFSQTEEESTSEPELPEEENKRAVELTPLEEAVFEEIENCYERYNEYSELAKVAEYGAEYNGESAEEIVRYGHLANEQIFNSDYLKELISKAGLQETYQAWLAERKNQEALTVL